MINKFANILLLFLPLFAIAQGERETLRGKVTYNGTGIKEILVVNIQAEREVRTDSLGFFSLRAKPGDVLVITESRVRERKITLTTDDIALAPLVIPIDFYNYELKEIVIDRSNITSMSLGLPMGAKYSVAERRDRAGNSMKPDLPNTMTGGFIPLDPIINAITGKRRELKTIIEIEKKEKSASIINDLYDEKEIIAEYKIPQEYVQGFIFYIVENKYFASLLKEKNFAMAKYLMAGMATQYLQLIADEK